MDSSLADLVNGLQNYLKLDRLPELAVLLIGVLVGLIGKNIYALVKNILGVAGSFVGRMASGWWQDLRRETPNIIDCSLGVVTRVEGRKVLLVDALLGPRRLTDVFLNPRTAFGVRLQAFFVKRERPWVHFPPPRRPERGLTVRFRAWRNARRIQLGLQPLPPVDSTQVKYRRVYAPIENLIGQYLTNEWAMQMAVGEPCYVFRFVVALVYEKYADDYIDRQFHALVIWEEVLNRFSADAVIVYQPEFRHRAETFRRIAAGYRASPTEFGVVHMMVPRRALSGVYSVHWVPNLAGVMIPIHRPVHADDAVLTDAGMIARLALRKAPDETG